MFTGIVQSQQQILSINTVNNLSRLLIYCPKELINGLSKGASVAINGVCLTAVDFGKNENNQYFMAFDVIDETLRVTNLSHLAAGNFVNVERSLKAGDELGGHIVSGHVHCQARVTEIIKTSTNCTMTFACDEKWLKYVLEKGFIAINGASLTVGHVENNQFNVHLIPETLAVTNIGCLVEGDNVNLEFDQQTITIVTTIERMKLSLS